MMKTKAFTIAEILITLAIIGVIASMTIPALAQTIIDRQMVSRLLKMQNILSTAYNNNFQIYGNNITDYSSKEQVIKAFEDGFIGVSHNCLNDTCLNDGSEISYSDFDASCQIEAPGSASTLKNSCMSIVTDLNGVNQKPNKPGKDRFRFWVTKDGVYPEGNLGSCSNGYDCTAYVILNQKLFDYEKLNAMQDSIPEGCIDAECTGCNDGYVLNNGVCIPVNSNIMVVNNLKVHPRKPHSSHADAEKYCNDNNMRLPTKEELSAIYSECISDENRSCNGYHFASDGGMLLGQEESIIDEDGYFMPKDIGYTYCIEK